LFCSLTTKQIYVQDVDAHDRVMRAGAAMDPDRPAGGWTDDAVYLYRIGLEPHSISLGPAHADLVETLLAVHAGPPHLSEQAEHVAEADLDIPTGVVSIVGCAQPPKPEHTLAMAPGLNRTRVSYVPSAPPSGSDPDVPGDYLDYQIDLRPAAEPGAITVVRPGTTPWAR
jgi:hypothetical protein